MKEFMFVVFLSCVSVLTVSAESELISSQRPIEVLAGYDVILPCHLEPPINVRSETVLWSRSDLKPKYVHYHQDGRLMFEHQDRSYSFRTRLFMDELMKGNVSMKIFEVKMSDAGTYICSLPSMKKEASIQLRVEQSDVIGSHEPVHVTVGHDVILLCHLEPQYDVRTLTVEWKRNESFVHVYRNEMDYLEDQDENFRGRTSLFIDELDKGNISVKLINVTEQDAGNYTCFVPGLDSQVRRGFINLIVDPEENRNKGNQFDSDKKENNNDRHYGLIALCIILVAAIVGIFIRRRCVKNNPPAGQGGAGPQSPQQPGLQAGNVQPDPGAGRDGRGQHQQVETDKSRDEGQESGAGPDGRGQDDQVETDDSRDKGPKLGAGPDGRGQYEQIEMVKMVDSRDEGRVEDETGEDNT